MDLRLWQDVIWGGTHEDETSDTVECEPTLAVDEDQLLPDTRAHLSAATCSPPGDGALNVAAKRGDDSPSPLRRGTKQNPAESNALMIMSGWSQDGRRLRAVVSVGSCSRSASCFS